MRASSKRKQGAIAAGGEGDGKTTTAASPGTPPSVAAFSPAAPVTPAGRASAGSDATASQHPPAPAQRSGSAARADRHLPRFRRRSGPERREHASSSRSVRHTRYPRRRGPHVRAHPRHAHPHHHQRRLHRRPHHRRHPLRGHRVPPQRSRRAHRFVPLEREEHRPLPQDRPRTRAREARRPPHETHPRSRRDPREVRTLPPSVSTPLPAASPRFASTSVAMSTPRRRDADADAWLERLAERTEPTSDSRTLSPTNWTAASSAQRSWNTTERATRRPSRAPRRPRAPISSPGWAAARAATDASRRRRLRLRHQGSIRRPRRRSRRRPRDRRAAVRHRRAGHRRGLVPIIEPEVDIHAPDKAAAETLVVDEISFTSTRSPGSAAVPQAHAPGGSARVRQPHATPTSDACVRAVWGILARGICARRLAACRGVAASFSRALVEGLDVRQSSEAFDDALARNVREIYEAALT